MRTPDSGPNKQLCRDRELERVARAAQLAGIGAAAEAWSPSFDTFEPSTTRFLVSALRITHFTVTVKQPVRSSFVGLVRLSTSRNMTSNCVPSKIVGATKSM